MVACRRWHQLVNLFLRSSRDDARHHSSGADHFFAGLLEHVDAALMHGSEPTATRLGLSADISGIAAREKPRE